MILCRKHENKCKRKGINVLPALGEENLAKRTEENDKKLIVSLVWFGEREREREKSLKNFWKVSLNKSNSVLKKKHDSRFSIDQNFRFEWSKQTEAHLKFLIAISIDWKTASIDRNSGKNTFLKTQQILCRNFSKHWILWIKCMSMRWNSFQKHKF